MTVYYVLRKIIESLILDVNNKSLPGAFLQELQISHTLKS